MGDSFGSKMQSVSLVPQFDRVFFQANSNLKELNSQKNQKHLFDPVGFQNGAF